MADPPAPTPADPTIPALNQPAPAAPQVAQQPPLNWSHFRPEFADTLEEDTEAYLLHTDDWMNTYNYPEDVKVQRFCLTLVGEARLWYKSLRLIENDWPALQEKIRWQYSKIRNTREQLFHAGDHFIMMRMWKHVCLCK